MPSITVIIYGGHLTTQMRLNVENVFSREAQITRRRLALQSPVGATGDLKQGWAYQFIDPALQRWVNHAENAIERIAGNPPYTFINILELQRWVQSKGMEPQAVYPISRSIQKQGSERFRTGNNFIFATVKNGKITKLGRLSPFHEFHFRTEFAITKTKIL